DSGPTERQSAPSHSHNGEKMSSVLTSGAKQRSADAQATPPPALSPPPGWDTARQRAPSRTAPSVDAAAAARHIVGLAQSTFSRPTSLLSSRVAPSGYDA